MTPCCHTGTHRSGLTDVFSLARRRTPRWSSVMPLYEYKCEACGKRFEVIRKFSDPPLEVCTQCGKGPIQRLKSSPAIQFKGTGWYITDYSQKGKSGAEPSSSSKDETKKPDAGSTDASTAKADSAGASGSRRAQIVIGDLTGRLLAAPRVFPDTHAAVRQVRGAAARSRRRPSGNPPCCRCRAARRTPCRRITADRVRSCRRPLVSWISPVRSLAVASSAGKMSGVST